MRTPLPLFVLLLSVLHWAQAQPEPCVPPPTMTSTCLEACIICDIDGFTGRHQSDVVGQPPPGFAGECTFVAHNIQWIAFIAGSTDLSVQLTVSNCQMGFGLEFGLYKGVNCTNLQRISNCFGGATDVVGPGQSGIIENTEPLVIGQYYFIVMDGAFGDNCDWTFTVLSGSTAAMPLATSGEILGPDVFCTDTPITFFNEVVEGATIFDWTLDGAPVGDNTIDSLVVDLPDADTYELCVTARNVCESAPPTCRTIRAQAPPVTTLSDEYCAGDCYTIADSTLCAPGNYTFLLTSYLGCDSTVNLALTELPVPETFLDVAICTDDTLFIDNVGYTAAGDYEQTVLTAADCDSIVYLTLATIVCNIQTTTTTSPVQCQGEASGIISFQVTAGTPPFTYDWQHLESGNTGTGAIALLSDAIELSGLVAGTYLVAIEDDFANQTIIIAVIEEPLPLVADLSMSDYNGFGVRCADGADGTLTVQPQGGTLPYAYNWSTGASTPALNGLSAAAYAVTVIDANGCELVLMTELNEPPPLDVSVLFQDPGCAGLATGLVEVVSASGGVAPYNFGLNSAATATSTSFPELSPGTYTLAAEDANGCTADSTASLVAADIPVVTLSTDRTVTLGEVISLSSDIQAQAVETLLWTGVDSLSCTDCPRPMLQPLNDGFYTLTVTSTDGCIGQDSLFITVEKKRAFYAPTAFSPNGDGVNDRFSLFGGPEVARIASLQVFDRWGGQMYAATDLTGTTFSEGWPGTSRGQAAPTGLYAWVAEIEFIDGVREWYGGEVVLMR